MYIVYSTFFTAILCIMSGGRKCQFINDPFIILLCVAPRCQTVSARMKFLQTFQRLCRALMEF